VEISLTVFYATFAPGLQELIAEVISNRLPGARIIELLDGAVLFKTSVPYEQLNVFCFNNVFVLISRLELPLEAHIRALVSGSLSSERARTIIANKSSKIRSFRIVSSVENRLVSIDPRLLNRAEHYFAALSGMQPNRVKPDAEFWFLQRSEGFSLCMKRLSRHASWDKSLHPGELPPPLAWLLCYLSKPAFGQMLADPFCGYGSIPLARFRYFPPPALFQAWDLNESALNYARSRLLKYQSAGRLSLEKSDAFSLAQRFPAGLDAIITDPPWGLYQEGISFNNILKVCSAALKPGGRAVVLSAAEQNLEAPGLEQERNVPFLLSGKKARVIVYINR
jgi:predicted RNA methylase